MLKPFLLFFAVTLLVCAPLAVPAQPPQEATPAASKIPVKATAESQAKAKKLYSMDCALCHGQTGDGKTDLAKDMQLNLADWTDPKWQSGAVDQELFNTIRHGKGKMPAEDAGRAKDDEVWNLIIYIRSLAQSAPATPATPSVAPATPPAATPSPTPNH